MRGFFYSQENVLCVAKMNLFSSFAHFVVIR